MVDRVGRPVVAFAMEWMPQYRLSFYDALSTELNRRDIDMRVFHGDAAPNRKGRHDAVKPEWARYRPNRRVRLGGAVGARTLHGAIFPWVSAAGWGDFLARAGQSRTGTSAVNGQQRSVR